MNVNFVDENLKDLEVPINLLLKVHLLRCNNGYDLDCTTPGGMVTDFNIWDRAFSPEELTDWTTCRFRISEAYILRLIPLCILGSWESIKKNQKGFFMSFLIMETSLGVKYSLGIELMRKHIMLTLLMA